MARGAAASLMVLLLARVAMADSGIWRVFEPPATPDDRRLQKTYDVDHPSLFWPEYKDERDWKRRAADLREQVLVAEDLWPLPVRTPLNPVIHGKIERDDYTIEKVFFASYPGHYVSGNLYRPKNASGKLPAVLCPHGHWPNGRFYETSDEEARKQIDKGAEQTMQGAKYPIQARCAMLARMGCIVFHYDMVGYADSTAIDHRTGFTDAEAILRLQSFMGLQTWNSIRALDFVLGLDDVDGQRIAVTGASGGGTQTFILGVVDERPAVEFPAVMVSEDMQGGCICENAPLLRINTNNAELAATFAPKPLAMSAADDWTRAMETDTLPKIQSIYSIFGAKEMVAGRHFSFEHNYNQVSREMMYNWMNKHLKLGWQSPVKEKPFEPVPPRELSVYDDQHPRPSDSCDAKALRKYMTENSDRQLADLFRNDLSEYRRIVRKALRVMVSDDLPGGEQIEVRHASGPRLLEHVVVETGTLGRKGCGEAVPFVSLVPAGWNGAVVVGITPHGKSRLFDGDEPIELVRDLLQRKIAVLSADLFLTGEYLASDEAALKQPGKPEYSGQKYGGFSFGYNRSIMANRVHDLLTVLGYARGWKGTKSVDLVAVGDSGPVALLADALAADAVRRAAIDLHGFDFDQVQDDQSPMMLPGALKYGGVYGFVPLLENQATLLVGAQKSGAYERAAPTRRVQIESDECEPEKLVQFVKGM